MGARVSFQQLLAATNFQGAVRVGSHDLMVATNFSGAVRVSKFGLIVAQSPNRAFVLSLLDSDSTIFGVSSYTVKTAAAPTPEYNPYKPIVPDQVRDKLGPDVHAYLEENQETHREQHNLIQAGDTTFPYQLVISSHPTQHYKLGSVGRFFHEDYGVIKARYVKFDKMVAVPSVHSPVGLFRNKESLDWTVTNDISLSDPDLVVGISAPWILPADGEYGWVIVDGPNLQRVQNNSTTFATGESFAWDSNGTVSNSAKGKVLGRRIGKTSITGLPAGSMWVRTESFSEAKINDIIQGSTKGLLDSLTALQQQLANVPAASEFATLSDSVAALKKSLLDETNARLAGDLDINERISNLDFVTVTQLDNAVNLAASGLSATMSNLQAQVTALAASLNTQTARIDSMAHIETTMQSQIDSLLRILVAIDSKPRVRFPVVDGSVPPNLVYLDDGSLVYTEE